MQRNWIGRSEGVTFAFDIENVDARIEVFTTRVDTMFGATFVAIAPEHAVVAKILERMPKSRRRVEEFAATLRGKGELERTQLMEKTGVPTGAYAINPLSRERIPIWVTNYVLAEYGTGAVMGVPAHDERDFAFAKKHGLTIAQVITTPDGSLHAPLKEAYVEDGKLIASGEYTGMKSFYARRAIAARLEAMGRGGATVNYRFRDWLVSRQRYWGTPIPIVSCERDGLVPVPDGQLPVLLPKGVAFTGQGSPLANDAAFVNTTCPRCGGPAMRDPDTMDTFVDSSWYFVRYLDPHNAHAPFDRDKASRWMPVDQYIGGAEHAVMHLLYARFFTMFLVDEGYLAGVDDEPFTRLFNQGTLLYGGEKMSKSRGNVVGIDETVEKHGVDAMRLFLLKAAPPEDALEWTDEGIVGRVRFVQRVWRAAEPLASVARSVPLDRLPEMRGDARARAGARVARRAGVRQERDRDAALPLQRHDGEARRAGEPARRGGARAGRARRSRRPLRRACASDRPGAVRAASGRRAVGEARLPAQRPPRALARARSRGVGNRRDHARRPSERQGARAHLGRAGDRRGGGVRARDGAPNRHRADRRQIRAQTHLRPGQAPQHRGGLNMTYEIRPGDALVVVDVQHDFLPGGALAVAEGERIFGPIAALAPRFPRVYATRDWHPHDHSSFAEHGGPWPVHCVAGTHGAAFDERLDLSHVDVVVDKGTARETDGYSGFAATTLADDLRAHGVRRLFVCGLATDYCVKATALDARDAGFETVVIEDAAAAVNVNAGDEKRALDELRDAGVSVATSADVAGASDSVRR